MTTFHNDGIPDFVENDTGALRIGNSNIAGSSVSAGITGIGTSLGAGRKAESHAGHEGHCNKFDGFNA